MSKIGKDQIDNGGVSGEDNSKGLDHGSDAQQTGQTERDGCLHDPREVVPMESRPEAMPEKDRIAHQTTKGVTVCKHSDGSVS
jgi:hypothetical protein